MTLLELLRQELPKRGGWPEGAVKATSYGFIPGVHFWDDNDFMVDYSDLTTRALGEEKITREQYEATGWDGTGLPPVGVECEYLDSNNGKWYPVTMKYVSDQIVVICGMTNILGEEQGTEIAKDIQLDKPQFRPLRTEAERAIDEMVRLSGVSTGAAKILYDAGYRKG